MRIPAAGEDHKGAGCGGLDDASGHVIHQLNARKDNARKDEEAFLPFLDALANAFPADEPVVVVLDNASDHKSHAVRAMPCRNGGAPMPTSSTRSFSRPTHRSAT
jgi:hypothetical protein